MNEREHPGTESEGDEAPEGGEATRADTPGSHEYPLIGPNAKTVHDDESQARRPSEKTDPSVDEVDGDPTRGGMPLGTPTHGS